MKTGEMIFPKTSQWRKPIDQDYRKRRHVCLVERDEDFAHYSWVMIGDEMTEMLMLIDTGAQISIIRYADFQRIPKPSRPKLQPSQINITVGDGKTLGCEGVAVFKIRVNYLEFKHPLYVCREATQNIMGNDFIFTNKGVIASWEGKMTLQGHQVPIFNKMGLETSRRVQLTQKVTLPVGQEIEVPAEVKGELSGATLMFEGNELKEGGGVIRMPRILFSGQDHIIRIRMFNAGTKEVQLYPRTTLGKLSEVESIEDIPFEAGRGPAKRPPHIFTFKQKPDRLRHVHVMEAETADPQLEEPAEEVEIEVPEHVRALCDKTIEEVPRHLACRVKSLLRDYSDIFAVDSNDIGKTDIITHDVDTGDAKPISQAVRRQSPEEHAAMKKAVEELQEVGVVRPSKSQWASNVRMAKKKNGSWRMCIDYRDLNKRTIIHDPYPLPRIDAMIDALGKGKFFSCLDLIWGYHQVPLTRRAQERTAFITPQMSPSHWEYIYMPFGLMGAPATFQRLVDSMLRGIQYNTCMAYLDDIVVISETLEEGMVRLREVFDRVRDAHLKLKAEKCELFKTEIKYLGHVISAEGVRTDPKKVSAIQDFALPLFVTDVRGFLGLCSYYRNFIGDFSNLTKPLNDLTKQDSDRVWRKEHTKAFLRLKELLSDTPVLAFPKEGCTFILDTDASGYAIGGVLSQLQPWTAEDQAKMDQLSTHQEKTEENKEETPNQSKSVELMRKSKKIPIGNVVERPIAYASRMLLPRELNYCARRREMLAIFEMVQQFYHHIAGTHFIIRTDHDSLKGVKNLAKVSGQFARWIDYLEAFDFEIKVRKGKENGNADFLSRMYSECFCKDRKDFEKTPSACEALENEPVLDWDLFEAANREMRNRQIRNKAAEIIRVEDKSILHLLTDEQLEWQTKLAAKIIVEPPGLKAEAPLLKTRVTGKRDRKEKTVAALGLDTNIARNPRIWSLEELRTAQKEDEELSPIYEAKINPEKEKPSWNDISYEGLGCKFYYKEWSRIRFRDQLLYREWESVNGEETRLQLIVPRKYQTMLIGSLHCTLVGAHQGARKMLEYLRLRYFWYGMSEQIKLYIKCCHSCQKTKNLNFTPRVGLQLHGAGFPNERVHVDFCGPVVGTEQGMRYFMIMVDAFSKFTVAVATENMTSATAADAFLTRWVNLFGSPYEVTSDRGASFTAALWEEFCNLLNMNRMFTTAYRPQSNGQAERANRNIIDMLRAVVEDSDTWDLKLPGVCAAYNFTPHSAHGFSPYYLMFGRQPVTQLDVIAPNEVFPEPRPRNEVVREIQDNLSSAHSIARRRLKKAAEVSRKYYDRGSRLKVNNYVLGERAWLKVGQKRRLEGKFTDKFEGPYYIISTWNTGTYRIKQEENDTPRIVHHDRLRKCVDDEVPPQPDWVARAIVQFGRTTKKKKKIQTEMTLMPPRDSEPEDEGRNTSETSSKEESQSEAPHSSDEDDGLEISGPNGLRKCSHCGNGPFDEVGIYRTIRASGRCHICDQEESQSLSSHSESE